MILEQSHSAALSTPPVVVADIYVLEESAGEQQYLGRRLSPTRPERASENRRQTCASFTSPNPAYFLAMRPDEQPQALFGRVVS
jgi:hypothetical protein